MVRPLLFRNAAIVLIGVVSLAATARSQDSNGVHIDTIAARCNEIEFEFWTTGDTSFALRGLRIDQGVNAKLYDFPTGISGQHVARATVRATDRRLPASGWLLVTSTSGATARARFELWPVTFDLSSGPALSFGEMHATEVLERRLVITSTMPGGVLPICDAKLRYGNGPFRITSTSPIPAQLSRGDSIYITLQATAPEAVGHYFDTLDLCACYPFAIPISSETVFPCAITTDLDFGSVRTGEIAFRELRLCNNGGGRIVFGGVSADPIEWDDSAFVISQADLEMLRDSVLHRYECASVLVQFRSDRAGVHRAVAAIVASPDNCTSTTAWTANVTAISTADDIPVGSRDLRIDARRNGTGYEVEFFLPRPAQARIALLNSSGYRAGTAIDAPFTAGKHVVRLDAGGIPSGLYFLRIESAGAMAIHRLLLLR